MIIVLKQGTTKDQISTFSNELNQTYGVTVKRMVWRALHCARAVGRYGKNRY